MRWRSTEGLGTGGGVELPVSHNKGGASSVFQLGTEAESTQATSDIYEKEAAIEVDYSSLREDLKVNGGFPFMVTVDIYM